MKISSRMYTINVSFLLFYLNKWHLCSTTTPEFFIRMIIFALTTFHVDQKIVTTLGVRNFQCNPCTSTILVDKWMACVYRCGHRAPRLPRVTAGHVLLNFIKTAFRDRTTKKFILKILISKFCLSIRIKTCVF